MEYELETKKNRLAKLQEYFIVDTKHESFSSEQEIRLAPYFVKENDSHITYKTGKIIRTVYVIAERIVKSDCPLR